MTKARRTQQVFECVLVPQSEGVCLCLGGGRSPASRPHGEPAGNLQNPQHPRWDSGAPGGDVADGFRRQRPHLHLHLPLHLQSLCQHPDCPAAAAGQVGRMHFFPWFFYLHKKKKKNMIYVIVNGCKFKLSLVFFSLAGMGVWKKIIRKALKAVKPLESETQF